MVDELVFEYDQSQFVAGKQLQVFPFATDGGFQSNSRTTNTMFEIFNSKYRDKFGSSYRGRGRGGFGGYYGGHDNLDWR